MARIGSLFTGIGGFELGAEAAGLGEVVWQVEIDPFARAVLARHWPNVDRSVTDVTLASPRNLAPVDVLIGGFPCQDTSSAGKGAGLEGKRSGLWYEYLRCVREFRPRLAIIENVTSGAKRWVRPVRHDLHLLGYRTRAIGLSAFDVGAPHLRRRVFLFATDPEREPLRLEPRRRRGEGGAGSAELAHDGETRPTPHADREGELQPSGRMGVEWKWTRDGSRWRAESPVPGVAYGVSARLDIERAYGNAVVPKCVETAIRYFFASGGHR